MSGRLWLFSSKIERDAAFSEGIPGRLRAGITGVGLIDAAIGTVDLVGQFEPDEIIYLGTCGAYPNKGLKIGEIVAAENVLLCSGDTARQEMRIPKLLPTELRCSSELTGRMVKERSDPSVSITSANVVCTIGVTENNSLAETLGGVGQVENLEVFSVLRAAGFIPTTAILGVTNIVGEGGGVAWGANYRWVMALLASLFCEV